MFGIKIIKESEYNELILIKKEFERRIDVVVADLKKEKKDCESLREQNGELRKKLNKFERELMKNVDVVKNLQREVKSLREFKRDTLEAMGQIDLAGFRLSYCTKKCKNCEHEQKDCKKYEFGTHQYCVIPK